jgi:hypothetical protein
MSKEHKKFIKRKERQKKSRAKVQLLREKALEERRFDKALKKDENKKKELELQSKMEKIEYNLRKLEEIQNEMEKEYRLREEEIKKNLGKNISEYIE